MGKRLKFDERFLQAKREIKSFSEKNILSKKHLKY